MCVHTCMCACSATVLCVSVVCPEVQFYQVLCGCGVASASSRQVTLWEPVHFGFIRWTDSGSESGFTITGRPGAEAEMRGEQ